MLNNPLSIETVQGREIDFIVTKVVFFYFNLSFSTKFSLKIQRYLFKSQTLFTFAEFLKAKSILLL
jgi:hypothetical protein